jgi:hypothetical protein
MVVLAPMPRASEKIAAAVMNLPSGARLFPHAHARTEFASRLEQRLTARHAGLFQLIGSRLDMELHLVLEFAIEIGLSPEVEQPPREFFQPVHIVLSMPTASPAGSRG